MTIELPLDIMNDIGVSQSISLGAADMVSSRDNSHCDGKSERQYSITA
jgi:hypothetical protein